MLALEMATMLKMPALEMATMLKNSKPCIACK